MKKLFSGRTLTAVMLAVMMLAGGIAGALAEGTETAAAAEVPEVQAEETVDAAQPEAAAEEAQPEAAAEEAQPVLLASVNGEEIWSNNAEMQKLVEAVVDYYTAYGYEATDPFLQAFSKAYGLEWAVEGVLYNQKAAELGVADMTEEQKAEITAQAKKGWDEALAYYEQSIGGLTETSTDEEKAQAHESALAYIQQNFGYTEESYINEFVQSTAESQLRENVQKAVLGEIGVTDEEVISHFNELVEEDKGNYEGNIPMYEYYTNYMGSSSYYVPEGYRGITHILLNVDSELMTRYTELAAKLEEQKAAETEGAEDTAEEPAAEPAEETAAEPAEEKAAEPAEEKAAEPAEAAAEAAPEAGETPAPAGEETAAPEEKVTQEMVDAAKQAILDSVQAQVSEIMAKYEAGTPFADLIDEYGNDPGMKQEPRKTDGYAVHKDSIMWDPAFTAGAMALTQIGDVSEPVLSTSGIHLIHYTRDIPAGAVELTDEMRASLKEELLGDKENTMVAEMVEQWKQAAEIVYTAEGQAIRDAAEQETSESVETTEATEEALTGVE